jgi:hypothetical protein
MSEPLYLFDTNKLLCLARGGPLGQHIDARLPPAARIRPAPGAGAGFHSHPAARNRA